MSNIEKMLLSLSKDRSVLAQAITMLESSLSSDRYHVNNLFTSAHIPLGHHHQQRQQQSSNDDNGDNNNISIGITGAPGVGKSTFIEALGTLILNSANGNTKVKSKSKDESDNSNSNDKFKENDNDNHDQKRLAVLTTDPSSSISGGSILGDKIRMPNLSNNPRAFIRSSPLGDNLIGGGVISTTFDTIKLCHMAGYQTVIVESVGIGQSETIINNLVDCLLYLQIPGSGDELQAMKKGIIELVDLIVINKSDLPGAMNTEFQFKSALKLSLLNQMDNASNENGNENGKKEKGEKMSRYQKKVLSASSKTGHGLDQILTEIHSFISFQKSTGLFNQRRKRQEKYWIHQNVKEQLLKDFNDFNLGLDSSRSSTGGSGDDTLSSLSSEGGTIWFKSQKFQREFYDTKQRM